MTKKEEKRFILIILISINFHESRLYVKSVTIFWKKKKRNFEIIYIVIRSNELNLLQFWYFTIQSQFINGDYLKITQNAQCFEIIKEFKNIKSKIFLQP